MSTHGELIPLPLWKTINDEDDDDPSGESESENDEDDTEEGFIARSDEPTF
jgi:hypothetical protein